MKQGSPTEKPLSPLASLIAVPYFDLVWRVAMSIGLLTLAFIISG
jgi:hypothetical protein